MVMAMLFPGRVVTWDGERDLLKNGAENALLIAALSQFVTQKPKERRSSARLEAVSSRSSTRRM